MAHNFVMDIYRNSQRVPHLSDRDAEFLLSHRADPAPDPEQVLLRKEILTRLDTAVAKLNIEQRNCLRLRAHCGTRKSDPNSGSARNRPPNSCNRD
jgi:DNA-directed RNA polymerase specialized sigma24 family protein